MIWLYSLENIAISLKKVSFPKFYFLFLFRLFLISNPWTLPDSSQEQPNVLPHTSAVLSHLLPIVVVFECLTQSKVSLITAIIKIVSFPHFVCSVFPHLVEHTLRGNTCFPTALQLFWTTERALRASNNFLTRQVALNTQ